MVLAVHIKYESDPMDKLDTDPAITWISQSSFLISPRISTMHNICTCQCILVILYVQEVVTQPKILNRTVL